MITVEGTLSEVLLYIQEEVFKLKAEELSPEEEKCLENSELCHLPSKFMMDLRGEVVSIQLEVNDVKVVVSGSLTKALEISAALMHDANLFKEENPKLKKGGFHN